jgi:molybdate transport system substrate-binding protein
MKWRRLGLAIALVASLGACQSGVSAVASTGAAASGPAVEGTARVPPASLTVFAAASLKAALTNAADLYQGENTGTTITLSTDSSTALETKIEQAAPADVFLSADTTNPQKLVDGGFAPGPVHVFARNKLTVVVPTGNPAGIQGPADLARRGVKVVAAGVAVPITTYADQVVANLANQPGYPTGFAAAYAANIVSREDNVAAVISKIELGEGDAAIVYVTDATTSTKVQTIAIPDAANVIATYGGVVMTASTSQVAAASFLAWLGGSEGQGVLASFGFLPPS